MTGDGFAANNNIIKADVHMMFDRKAADSYLGCTGAHCDLCTHSKEVCVQKVKNREMFVIDRDVQTMHQIFDDLEVDGVIQRSAGDYEVQQGQIDKLIPLHDVKSTQVLHGLLWSFDHFMKAAVHVKADVFHWSEMKGSCNKLFIDNSKVELKELFMSSGINQILQVRKDRQRLAILHISSFIKNIILLSANFLMNGRANFRKWGATSVSHSTRNFIQVKSQC